MLVFGVMFVCLILGITLIFADLQPVSVININETLNNRTFGEPVKNEGKLTNPE